MLVRTTKRIAGFPPPGKVGEVDDEKGRVAVERGDAEDMSSLSTRLRRPEPSRPNHPPEVERGEGGWSQPYADPADDATGGSSALPAQAEGAEVVVHSPTTFGGKGKAEKPPAKSS